jgi:hypothetical protein
VNKDLIGIFNHPDSVQVEDPENEDETITIKNPTSWFKTQWDEVILNTGLEYQYGSFVAFRGGYIYDREGDIKKLTLGAGLQYRDIMFDFAYIPSGGSGPLDNTTRLSLSLSW